MSEPVVYSAGVINYRNYEDLSPCLESLQAQTLAPAQITVVDADPDESRLALIEEAFPTVSFERVSNHGFAGGANRLGCSTSLRAEARAPERWDEWILAASSGRATELTGRAAWLQVALAGACLMVAPHNEVTQA